MYLLFNSRKRKINAKNIYEYKKLIIPNYLRHFFSKKFNLLIFHLQDINMEIKKKQY